jgi:hypothetical protein
MQKKTKHFYSNPETDRVLSKVSTEEKNHFGKSSVADELKSRNSSVVVDFSNFQINI